MKPGIYIVAGRGTFYIKGRPRRCGDVVEITRADANTGIVKHMLAMGALVPQDVVEAAKPQFPSALVAQHRVETEAESGTWTESPKRRKKERSDND